MTGNSYSHTTRRCERKSETIPKGEKSLMRKHYGDLGAERLSRLLAILASDE